MSSITGKVAVVTGAASGIGQAISVEYARKGAVLVLADLVDSVETAALIKEVGGKSISVKCDVTSEASVKQMYEVAEGEFGHVDILVNNAGIYAFAPIDQVSVEMWDNVFAVNVRGCFLCIQGAVPLMKKAGAGRVVNISSSTFFMGLPFLSPYVATKGALVGMSRSLATELAEFNIGVNVITPGIVETKGMTAAGVDQGFIDSIVQQQCVKRLEQPSDLVGVAVFLASPESEFITGQLINVDGGLVKY